jgi:hypothetical protein
MISRMKQLLSFNPENKVGNHTAFYLHKLENEKLNFYQTEIQRLFKYVYVDFASVTNHKTIASS